jgi:hypothetical protein
LDEVQAFRLDSALAMKYWLREKDEMTVMYENILDYLHGFIQSQSKKKLPSPDRRKPLLRSNDDIESLLKGEEPLPDINELRQALVSGSTIVGRKV